MSKEYGDSCLGFIPLPACMVETTFASAPLRQVKVFSDKTEPISKSFWLVLLCASTFIGTGAVMFGSEATGTDDLQAAADEIRKILMFAAITFIVLGTLCYKFRPRVVSLLIKDNPYEDLFSFLRRQRIRCLDDGGGHPHGAA